MTNRGTGSRIANAGCRSHRPIVCMRYPRKMYSSTADCSGTSTMMIANDTAQSGFGPALPPPSAAPRPGP